MAGFASGSVWSGLVGTMLLALVSCTEPTQPPLRFPVLRDEGTSDWIAVSAGGSHTCALKVGGSAYCWGDNTFGQTGVAQGDTICGIKTFLYRCVLAPRRIAPALQFLSISAGQNHTCGITLSRDAYCWGDNEDNEVGESFGSGPEPVKVVGTLPWSQISAGQSHTCAVRSDGALFCWGANGRGELGTGNVIPSAAPLRVPLPGLAASVSAGAERTCARTTQGAVYCWGAIWLRRQNGLEITRAQMTPEPVPTALSMSWLSVGSFTTCGAAADGTAFCWEANPRGEMGIGNQTGSTIPLPVDGNLRFVQMAAGIVQTCGIATDGSGYCWGDDSFGQLGVPPSLVIERCGGQQLPCTTVPRPIIGTQKFIDVSTGFGSHSCGVTTRGNLYCWGLGSSGQRGDGTIGGAISTPLRVVEPGASTP